MATNVYVSGLFATYSATFGEGSCVDFADGPVINGVPLKDIVRKGVMTPMVDSSAVRVDGSSSSVVADLANKRKRHDGVTEVKGVPAKKMHSSDKSETQIAPPGGLVVDDDDSGMERALSPEPQGVVVDDDTTGLASKADIFILTASIEDARYTLAVFENRVEALTFVVDPFDKPVGKSYYIGTVLNKVKQRLRVVIGWQAFQTHFGTGDYMDKLYKEWTFDWLIMTGIACGIPSRSANVELGDVCVAMNAWGYESLNENQCCENKMYRADESVLKKLADLRSCKTAIPLQSLIPYKRPITRRAIESCILHIIASAETPFIAVQQVRGFLNSFGSYDNIRMASAVFMAMRSVSFWVEISMKTGYSLSALGIDELKKRQESDKHVGAAFPVSDKKQVTQVTIHYGAFASGTTERGDLAKTAPRLLDLHSDTCAVDIETMSLFQCANGSRYKGVRVLVAKGVSDLSTLDAGDAGSTKYWHEYACSAAAAFVRSCIWEF